MTVSERDRAYMRRLGEIQDELNAEDLARHLALPLAERVEWSLRLGEWWKEVLSPADGDPGEFYERARELGLYRA